MAGRAAISQERLGPLFGRTEIFDELLRQLEDAREGQGRALILAGDSGIGKSTILRAAVESARDLGYEVRWGRALPVDPPLPFALIQELVRTPSTDSRVLTEEAEPEESSVLPLFFAPRQGGILADAVFQRREPAGDSPTKDPADRLLAHLSDTTERIDSNRSTIFVQISNFLLELAREHPMLLAMDDLQFADDSSLDFLEQFLPLLSDRRIVVIATVPAPGDCPPRTAEAVERILRAREVTQFKVRPMTESELAQYIRWILRGKDPGRDAVMRWFTQTDGNPLFTEHLVRASTGFTSGSPSEARSQDFAEILRGRIRELAEPERRVLAYGAVLGKEFDFPTLARASDQKEERLSESLDKLVHGGLLREKPGEVYGFVSERVRSDVYAQLTETRRRILHRRVAESLLTREPKGGDSVYELARQFYLGRNDEKAIEYNQRSADLAAQAYAFEVAVVHLERAIECVRRIEPRHVALELSLLIAMGRFSWELGDLQRSEEVLADAVTRSRAQPHLKPELALALLGLARTRYDISQYGPARELAGEAYQILDKLGNHRGLLSAHQVLGLASWRLGDLRQAELHQREELALAERYGTPAEQGHALIDLANTFTQLGPVRLTEALSLYERAGNLFLEGNDHSARARVLMNRALLLHNVGQREEALTEMIEAFESAQRSHSRIWIGYCSLNLAQFYAEARDLSKAKSALDRTVALLEPLGDQLARQQVRMIRGLIAVAEEDFDGAESANREALTLAEELHLGAEIAEMKYRQAVVAKLRGNRIEARQLLTDAEKAGVLTLRGDLTEEFHQLARQLQESP